jgi:hypothetical protein
MTTLYRPVGLAELALMFDTQMRSFPPRLPEQPIFYPVLNREYAIQIARDWNAPSQQSGFSGFVTEISIGTQYLEQFPVQTVGGSVHQELWVPAERLAEFNREIQGTIRITDAFFGEAYTGFIPREFGFACKTATEQLVCLSVTFGYSGMDFICETATNHKAIYLNYPFWLSYDFSIHGVSLPQRDRVLDAIRQLWQTRFPQTPLYDPHAIRPNA